MRLGFFCIYDLSVRNSLGPYYNRSNHYSALAILNNGVKLIIFLIKT